MPIDGDMRKYLDQLGSAGIRATHKLSAVEARANLKQRRAMARTDLIEMAAVEDTTIPSAVGGLPIRIYRPFAREQLPILLYMHGGGWVTGDLDTQDFHCRTFARGARCIVVSVDYRLAPEHKFPSATEDCYSALEWVAKRGASFAGDTSRIAVAGPSAGGNLAAVLALMARDRGGPPIHYQMLLYPVTDFSYETASYRENAEGYLLGKEDMEWYWAHYLSDVRDGLNPYASPLRATGLGGLPPAYVATAEYDPLRDEGEAYADRLRAAGVRVTLRRHLGLIHGYFGMTDAVPAASVAVEDAVRALAGEFE